MIRALHISPRSFGEAVGGGERYGSELYRSLRERSDVEVDWCGVDEHGRISPDGRAVGRANGLAALVRLARRAEIVHVHQLNSLAFDVSWVLAKALDKRLVLTDYGGGWRNPGRMFGPLRLRGLDAVCAITEWSLADLGFKSVDRGCVILGGGDHVLDHQNGAPAVRRRTDFLFLGRLLQHKGIHNLIEALPPDRSLRIVGASGFDWYMEELERLAQGKDVELVRDAPDSDLSSYYKHSDYTVLPSTYRAYGRTFRRPELLGLVLLESLFCGTPFIASTAGGLAEVAARASMPSFAPSDLAALRRLLETVPRGGTDEHARLQRSALEASERFTWAQTAGTVVAQYREVLRSG